LTYPNSRARFWRRYSANSTLRDRTSSPSIVHTLAAPVPLLAFVACRRFVTPIFLKQARERVRRRLHLVVRRGAFGREVSHRVVADGFLVKTLFTRERASGEREPTAAPGRPAG